MSTKKGLISIFFGSITSLIGTIFQFILMFLLIDNYGVQFNGFIKISIAILSFLGGVEGGLGALSVIFLVKPLMQRDWARANQILNTARKHYMIGGIIDLSLMVLISLGYSAFTSIFKDGVEIITASGSDSKVYYIKFWEMLLILLIIGGKNIPSLFWTAPYENLLQADQNNYIRRIVLMICDLITYTIIFYSISKQVAVVFIFMSFLFYSILKSTLIYLFVRTNYPWIVIKKQKDDLQLVKWSNNVALKNVGESLLVNADIVIIALLLGFRISSAFSLYMTIAIGVRSIMMILINSFKEFFASWTAKNGRINWSSYIKFETYAYMIGAFLFVNQFILSPYFVTSLYAPQVFKELSSWSGAERQIFEFIFYKPTFSLFIALSSVFIIIAEPCNVLVYAKARYKQTSIPLFAIGLVNVVLSSIVALITRYANNNYLQTVIAVLVINCLMTFVRFVYLWCYTWLNLTYNSSFKGVWRNWLVLLIPIIISILVNYLYLTKTYNPENIYIQKDKDVIVNWGWPVLLTIFFTTVMTSGVSIFINSLIWAPLSVWGLTVRLPLINQLWARWTDAKRKERKEKYEDDLIVLKEPENPYQRNWERDELVTKSLEDSEEIQRTYISSGRYVLKAKAKTAENKSNS